jgi:hypothetical protein
MYLLEIDDVTLGNERASPTRELMKYLCKPALCLQQARAEEASGYISVLAGDGVEV